MKESNNDNQVVRDIFSRLLRNSTDADAVTGGEINFVVDRLGKAGEGDRPRPVRVKVASPKIRNDICSKSKLLKAVEGFERIYVKRDEHPYGKKNPEFIKFYRTKEDDLKIKKEI